MQEQHDYEPDHYTQEEQQYLLQLARRTLEASAARQPLPTIDLATLLPALQAERACFVTLTQVQTGQLRGCTGVLAARQPLAREVIYTTSQTALSDPRFKPVRSAEVPYLHIEISVLTPMQPLDYDDPHDLLHLLRPEIDGVTLVQGHHRATFLPQVWERVPDAGRFLGMLCEKMNFPADAWLSGNMQVYTYQSIIIEEPHQ